MKIVQIANSKVHWITPYPTLADAPPFAPDIILVEAPDEVQEGWIYDTVTGEFTPPPEIPEPLPELPQLTNAEVIQQINDLRADFIIAGVIE